MNKKMMSSSKQWKIPTMVGNLYLVASDQGLQLVSWEKQKAPLLSSLRKTDPAEKILKQTEHELNEYFKGLRRKFTIPLDIQGTPFQIQVWKELLKIPYGQKTSYKDIAEKIKNKKAVRAVGSANGKNPVCIIIPCHRVISANGSLGGYSGGLNHKIQLLEVESQN